MADPARARKVAERIKVVVAETLEQPGQGPAARLRDGHRRPGDRRPPARDHLLHGLRLRRGARRHRAALESAKGMLRTEVGKRTGIRLTPSLEFVPDALPEGAAHLEDLLPRPRAPTPRSPRGRRGRATPATPTRTRSAGDDDEDDDARRGRRDDGRLTRGRRPAARRDAPRRQAGRLDQPRRRRPDAPAGRHPPGRPRRHARPDGHRRAGARGRPGDPAARPTWSAADKTYTATIRLGAPRSPTTPRARSRRRPTPRGGHRARSPARPSRR